MTNFNAMPPVTGRPPGLPGTGLPHAGSPRGGPGDGPPDRGFQSPGGYGPPSGYFGSGPAPAGAGILGKRRNPLAAWPALPLITLIVYFFVWVYKTNQELSAFDQRIKVDPRLSVLAFLVGWVVIVPPLVAAWRLGDRVRIARRAAGLPTSSTVLSFLLFLIGGSGVLFLQRQINAIWDRYPGAVEGQQVPLHQ